MNNQYGGLPIDIGKFNLFKYREFVNTLYLPVKIDDSPVCIPDNLDIYKPLIHIAKESIDQVFKYIYISVQNDYVLPNTTQKRPGNHVDGYLTDDETFIYVDSVDTTEYFNMPKVLNGSLDDLEALKSFEDVDGEFLRCKNKHLYDLKRCIHRSPIISKPHVRLFVKISFSNDKYNLKGNAKNHLLNYDWNYLDRNVTRNTPSKVGGY
jgi:hypothetical protein